MVCIIFAAVNNLRFHLDWIMYFLSADSRHGTHSPFVYALLDEVIYARRRADEPKGKVVRLVARLVDRFQPATVHVPHRDSPTSSPLDLVLLDSGNPDTLFAQLDALWPQFHSGSVLVLTGIYRTKDAKRRWQAIKTKPDVTVTIDLFRVGLVFFHNGQAKEDFKIRY